MTPVIARDMPLRELVEVMLGVCGRDAQRIQDLLQRGTVVESASRFRWEPLVVDTPALEALLAGFPQSDPSRRFEASRCVRAWLCGPRTRIELSREVGAAKRLFKRRSFWSVLMASVNPEYSEYSYRERADLFRSKVDASKIREAAGLLKYSGLAQQIALSVPEIVELAVIRHGQAASR